MQQALLIDVENKDPTMCNDGTTIQGTGESASRNTQRRCRKREIQRLKSLGIGLIYSGTAKRS